MNFRSLHAHRVLLSLLVAAALAVALMTILVIRQQHSQAGGQVFLESGGSVGANPFVPLVVPPAATGADQGRGGLAVQPMASTDNRPTCDPDKLASYLAGNPQASEAWVHALNSDRTLSWSGGGKVEIQQVPFYLHELTPRLLAEDLRVTNYQYTNGTALAVQSVLQKGTAVLVDAKGIARVRCACGNPLTPMVALKVPTVYRGIPWLDFQPHRVVVTQLRPQCGDVDYRGADGLCHPLSQPGPPRNDERPAQPPHPDHPAQPEKLPYPDEPDKPGRSDEPHSDKPDPNGRQPHYPDGFSRSDSLEHPDGPAVPDQPKHSGQPSHQDRPAQDRPPVESTVVNKPARPGAESEKSVQDRPATRVHQVSNPPAARPGHPDQPVPSGKDKPGQLQPQRHEPPTEAPPATDR
ncbi:MAG TPA: DUF6777 domain-containing protein [Pseudonocardiaceae bacterium]|nr:DUF6777 domain-containing protein [Pseudonocardiaceae bacterium]